MASKRLAKKKETSKIAKDTAVVTAVKEAPAVDSVKETVVETPKAEAPKTEEPKAEAAPKKTAARKTTPAKTQEIIWQFAGKEINEKEILDRVKAVWTGELGNKVKDLIDLKLYIKPEDQAAYYVINDDVSGSIEL